MRRLGASGPFARPRRLGLLEQQDDRGARAQGARYSIGVSQHEACASRRSRAIPERVVAAARRLPARGDRRDRRGHARRTAAGRPPHTAGRRSGSSSSPTGATTPSSPTAPRRSPWSRPNTAATPQIELAIRDLKEGSGAQPRPLRPLLRQRRLAVISCLAHNLLRWIARLGLHDKRPVVAQTIRRRYLTLPGRLTRNARRWTLHLPARWPWRESFTPGAHATPSHRRCSPEQPPPTRSTHRKAAAQRRRHEDALRGNISLPHVPQATATSESPRARITRAPAQQSSARSHRPAKKRWIEAKSSNQNDFRTLLKQTRQQPIARNASWISARRS